MKKTGQQTKIIHIGKNQLPVDAIARMIVQNIISKTKYTNELQHSIRKN